jgi:hypothetical protein
MAWRRVCAVRAWAEAAVRALLESWPLRWRRPEHFAGTNDELYGYPRATANPPRGARVVDVSQSPHMGLGTCGIMSQVLLNYLERMT